jgi:hypothetical protein
MNVEGPQAESPPKMTPRDNTRKCPSYKLADMDLLTICELKGCWDYQQKVFSLLC